MNNRLRYLLITLLSAPFICVIGLGSYHLFIAPEPECPDLGTGHTLLEGTVTDQYTGKKASHFRLLVRYGASGNLLVDTTFHTRGLFRITFIIPPEDKCESYWIERPVQGDGYWKTATMPNDTTLYEGFEIKKGQRNIYHILLQPASRLHFKIPAKHLTNDSIRVEVINEKTHQVEYTEDYAIPELQKGKPIRREMQISVHTPYLIRRIRFASPIYDTLMYTFTTKLQDTTQLVLAR